MCLPALFVCFHRTTKNKEWAATPKSPLQSPPPLQTSPLHQTPLLEATTRDVLLSSRKTRSKLRLQTISPLTPPTLAPAPNWVWLHPSGPWNLVALTTREVLLLGAKVAAKLPLTRHLPQPEGTEINIYMPSHHQQTLLQPATTAAAATAVCLTATSSLIQGWGTRVPLHLLFLLLLPAAPQYLSNSKVAPKRPGDTSTGPAVTPW